MRQEFVFLEKTKCQNEKQVKRVKLLQNLLYSHCYLNCYSNCWEATDYLWPLTLLMSPPWMHTKWMDAFVDAELELDTPIRRQN